MATILLLCDYEQSESKPQNRKQLTRVCTQGRLHRNLTPMTRTTMNDGRDGLPGAWLTLVSVPPVVVRTTGHCGGQTVIEAHQLPHLSYRGIADNRRSFSMNISSSMNFYFSRTSPRTYSLNIHSDSLGC